MNKNMMTQALPFTLPYWLLGIINFFAADDGADDGSDKTDDENGDDDTFVDDLDEEFGEDDDSEKDGEKDKGKDEKKSDKKDDKEKDKSSKKSSAIVQKQKYREQLLEARERIKELEGKKDDGRSLTEDEKKEKQANEFLVSKIKEVMKVLDDEKAKADESDQEAFQDELEEILEDNTDFTEAQILDVCEELDISPKAALKVLKREEKLKGKPKPKMPNSKRGTGKVEEDVNKSTKPKTLDDVNREAKEKIRKGEL